MFEGWSQRTRTAPGGRVERYCERELPDGSVEQWFYEVELSEYGVLETRDRSTESAPPRNGRAATGFRVEISAVARNEIVCELDEWDDREQGGALSGWVKDGKLVVQHAGGLGVGVRAKREASWLAVSLARFHDFAVSQHEELVGDWHSHRHDVRASTADREGWERARVALRADAYLGLILAPRRVVALGLTPWQDEEHLSWERPEVGAYVVTANGCQSVTPTLT